MSVSMLRSPLLLLPLAWIALAVYANMRADEPKACPNGSPVASCASAGCHGGGEPGKPFSEVTTWANGDPHSRAYRILFNEDSARIMKNLNSVGFHGDAWNEARCLACHASNGDVCFDEIKVNAANDGVGCDGCHGGSRQWLAKHYETGWKPSPGDGFRNNKDLVTRIENCAGCHVGDAKRTVNHDLIAAGHPRLAFEYARFHYLPEYKKHWAEALPEREFEIRAWFIGQVASLKLAVERTQAWHAKGPQPELSDQSCFSCHQPITGSPRVKMPVQGGWQPWHTATLAILANFTPELFPGAAVPNLKAFEQFEKAITKNELKSAGAALGELNAWLESLRKAEADAPDRSLPASTIRKLAHAIAASGSQLDDWDLACNHYLALAAIHHADPQAFSAITKHLEALRDQLKYAPGGTSPANYIPAKSASIFKTIADTLTPRGTP